MVQVLPKAGEHKLMLYRGRQLDPYALWAKWIDFPITASDRGEFSPLLMCPNPDHDARKPHFQLNLRRPLCHCFSNCGISGTYEKAIALIEGCTEREARRIILQSCSIPSAESDVGGKRHEGDKPRIGRRGVVSAAQPVTLDFPRYVPQAGMDYLSSRGIEASSIALWNIGWDSDERRIVIPADDERGTTRFLIKRAIRERDWPKYLYWPEREQIGWGKQDILFGACHLDQTIVEFHGLVLVEGSLDCIRLHQNGARNTVSILGSSVSERQSEIVSRIRPKKITLMFDKDVSGYSAIRSAHLRFPKYPLFVALYPKRKSDPAELSRKEVEKAIRDAIPIVKFNAKLPRNLRLERSTYGKTNTTARY